MRTLVVEEPPMRIEAPLLRAWGARGRGAGVLLQRQMKALMAAILLRRPGRDAVEGNAQLQPPHRELGQAARARRGKGRPVIAAQRPRQSVLAKGALQPRAHAARIRRRDATAQHITTPRIRNRQRVAARAVLRPKPALEVDAPHVVGRSGVRQGLRERHRVARPALRRAEPASPQQITDGARRGPRRRRIPPLQHGPQLLGPPVGCSWRNATTAAATAGAIARPCACGARDRSPRPVAGSASYRSTHLKAVLRLMP